ncbi:uncharacterized protein [Branchiostoma lanceolatum]|uniref:uncharacterized protein isoform X1 n=1 Tax=Branchiostoma lanceolatum TaxID=7740 RepID=UPI003455795C
MARLLFLLGLLLVALAAIEPTSSEDIADDSRELEDIEHDLEQTEFQVSLLKKQLLRKLVEAYAKGRALSPQEERQLELLPPGDKRGMIRRAKGCARFYWKMPATAMSC